MSDDQFTRLFTYMTEQFGDIKAKLDDTATKKQMNAVYDLLDKNTKEHQRQEKERTAMASPLDRLEKWVKQLADETGVTLHYE